MLLASVTCTSHQILTFFSLAAGLWTGLLGVKPTSIASGLVMVLDWFPMSGRQNEIEIGLVALLGCTVESNQIAHDSGWLFPG